MFNCTACIYQAATGWDLPPYRITIWLTDDAMLILVCLLVDLIQRFCGSYLTMETGGLELASTIILVLQPNRLTKCTSHPQKVTRSVLVNPSWTLLRIICCFRLCQKLTLKQCSGNNQSLCFILFESRDKKIAVLRFHV